MAKAKRKRNKTKGRRFRVLKRFERHGKLLARSKLGVIVDSVPKLRKGKHLFTHIAGYTVGKTFTLHCEGMFTVSELSRLIKKGRLKELKKKK
ncbi:MAG TPA: hypothetical protein VN665_00720 [Candidatus Paceibacterota bacterium]|nr:hypothetical protein [Candidatus Paceibacterota bacterium]